MAKYWGKLGYAVMRETVPGVIREDIVERFYQGDEVRSIRRLNNSEYQNDDISVQNEISIVADAFAYQNFHSLRYIWYMGSKWKVTSVEVQRPRLKISIGGLYHEQSYTPPDSIGGCPGSCN